jgi:hypothetical protein
MMQSNRDLTNNNNNNQRNWCLAILITFVLVSMFVSLGLIIAGATLLGYPYECPEDNNNRVLCTKNPRYSPKKYNDGIIMLSVGVSVFGLIISSAVFGCCCYDRIRHIKCLKCLKKKSRP